MELEVPRGIAVCTPAWPRYRYANLVVLDQAPAPDGLAGAVAIYRQARARTTLPELATIAWEQTATATIHGHDLSLLSGTWTLVRDEVLRFVHEEPVLDRGDLFLCPISARDWQQVSAMAIPADGFVDDGVRDWLLRERRVLVEAGLGQWWGAWRDNGQLLATCGAFANGTLVRLDQLLVSPAARRMGVGGWLVHAIARKYPGAHVIMEPEEGGWRSAMYQRVGFRLVGVTSVLLEQPVVVAD